jgi:hypothetical protein
MKKITGLIIVAIVICAFAYWYLQLGKKAVIEGKTVIENAQDNIGRAQKSLDDIQKK